MDGNQRIDTENIDEVILRLLKLNSGMQMDYQTYFKKILNRLAIDGGLVPVKKLPAEESDLLRKELKRVRNKEGRFVILKTKRTRVSSPPPPGGPGNSGGPPGGPPKTSSIIKTPPAGKITADKFFHSPYVEKVNVKDVTKKSTTLQQINEKLDSILETLNNIYDYERNESGRTRRDSERRRRGDREKELESRPFEGIKKAVSAITKPFQSIWDKIIHFITTVILARALLKIIDWFADPKNQDKITTIVRFFGDHWSKFLALYLRFGTGLGKFVGALAGLLIKGTLLLIKKTAGLAAALGLKGAGKVSKFLGGRGGKLLGAGLTIGANVAGIMGVSSFLEGGLFGEEKEDSSGNLKPPTDTSSSDTSVEDNIPKFSGGGWTGGLKNFFGNMFSGIGNMFSGMVNGPSGVDKVPAMLTAGEFVMNKNAVAKYGVDTLESMNAAAGGSNVNRPQVKDGGVTYASGGGYIGETPKEIRLRNNYEYRFGKDFASKLTNDQLRQISNHYNSLPSNEASRIDSRRMMGYPDELKNMAEEMIKGNKPQSFTQSSRTSAGLTNLETNLRFEEKISPRYVENLPKLNKPKPTIRTLPANRMLPAAGQSSANAMRSAEKAARLVRQPIPASSAIVPYTGGGLARTGVTGGLSTLPIQQIRTNMNVRGGIGGLRSAGIEMLANYLMDRGFDKVNAMIVANKIDEGKKLTGDKKENYIERLRNIVDREERWQRGFGGVFDSILGMGRETQSQKMSKNARAILEGIGSGAYQGGGIVGGQGLKEQSFKDAPKTQIMTDDKGNPFVGHKALRNGKVVYVRGPQPGSGTTNPLESLGRMINPGAYKDIDAANERKKYEEASKNSISSLRSRGASQATITKRQEELKKSVKPLPRTTTSYVAAGGGMGGKRGSRRSSNPPTSGSKPPSFSPNHSSRSTSTARSTLGLNIGVNSRI